MVVGHVFFIYQSSSCHVSPSPPPNPFTLAPSEYFLDEESEIEDESRRK